MTSTKVELQTAVLQELQVIGAEETASAADSLVVGNAADNLLAEIAVRDLDHDHSAGTTWDLTAIPDNLFDHLTVILAHRMARRFGKNINERAELRAEADEAWCSIFRVMAEQVEDKQIANDTAEVDIETGLSTVLDDDPTEITFY